jgi:hypothetical protein
MYDRDVWAYDVGRRSGISNDNSEHRWKMRSTSEFYRDSHVDAVKPRKMMAPPIR